MTQKCVTDEQYGRFNRRTNELWDRVRSRVLDYYEVVMIALQRIIEGALINGMFISPTAQFALLRARNQERGWGFTGRELAALKKAIPAWPEGRLSAVILDVSLNTVERTFEEAWHFTKAVQAAHWRWDSLKSGQEHLKLLDGVTHRRGLHWVVVDLGANWDRKDGISPADVRNPKTSPSSAILWAASYFPKWVRAMDGTTVPYVWVPGYEAGIPGDPPWSGVPNLDWGEASRSVMLGANRAGGRHVYWAVPVLRKSRQSLSFGPCYSGFLVLEPRIPSFFFFCTSVVCSKQLHGAPNQNQAADASPG